MNSVPSTLHSLLRHFRNLAVPILALAWLLLRFPPTISAQSDEILPLSQVRPGMQAMRTPFSPVIS